MSEYEYEERITRFEDYIRKAIISFGEKEGLKVNMAKFKLRDDLRIVVAEVFDCWPDSVLNDL